MDDTTRVTEFLKQEKIAELAQRKGVDLSEFEDAWA